MAATSREREEYLLRAEEAELMAEKFAGDAYFRTSWLHIAQSYRILAKVPDQEVLDQRDAVSFRLKSSKR